MAREWQPDLVILDVIIPEMDGLECCRRIKADRRTELIPVMMLTCLQGVDNEIAGIGSGADEFVTRPFHPEVLRTRIRTMLRHKSAIDRLEESETILFALAQAVEQRDHYTAGHCERLAVFSVAMGLEMSLPGPSLLALHRGGYLHDIGKIGIPDALMYKPGPLSDDEWRIMRTHTLKGEEICRTMRCLGPSLPIIRSHHERWDGSGYPDGLRGPEIPLLARVLQLADVFDALTTVRSYKNAMTPEDALETMRMETERAWYDPDLAELFFSLKREELSNAGTAVVPDAMRVSLQNMHASLSNA